MEKKATLLILAAGMGSRYGGLKQVDPLGPSGETIMDYSIYDAARAGFTKVVFVVREFFRKEFEERTRVKYGNAIELEFITQELDKVPEGCSWNMERVKPWGTAHAILVAKDLINEPFAVINADDFYGRDSFNVLARFLLEETKNDGDFSMVGFRIANTLSESGGVSRGICTKDENQYLTHVEEHHKIERRNGTITGFGADGLETEIADNNPVSMNMWGFTPFFFSEAEKHFREFLREYGQKTDSEFYIPKVVNMMLEKGLATVKVLDTESEWFGVTYKEDRPSVVSKLERLVKEGEYPTPLFKA